MGDWLLHSLSAVLELEKDLCALCFWIYNYRVSASEKINVGGGVLEAKQESLPWVVNIANTAAVTSSRLIADYVCRMLIEIAKNKIK